MSIRALSGILLSVSMLGLVSCASVPSFRPSSSIESAASLHEALLLCNEYSLPESATRPVALKPFVDCVSKAGEIFPSQNTEEFLTFRDELRRKYGALNASFWTPRLGLEMEIAIHAILRHLWSDDHSASSEVERQLVMRHFERTADILKARNWNSGAEPVLEPRLESLRASVAGLNDDAQIEGGSAEIAPENVELFGRLCERYAQLNSELQYLSQLWRDLVDMSLIDPRSNSNDRARRRYLARLDRAVKLAQDLRAELNRARESAGFRLGGCNR